MTVLKWKWSKSGQFKVDTKQLHFLGINLLGDKYYEIELEFLGAPRSRLEDQHLTHDGQRPIHSCCTNWTPEGYPMAHETRPTDRTYLRELHYE